MKPLGQHDSFQKFVKMVCDGGDIDPADHSFFGMVSHGADAQAAVPTMCYVHASDRFVAGAIMGLLSQNPTVAQLVMQGIIETYVLPQAVADMKPVGHG